MREPPRLADARIRAVIQTHYGLSIVALAFLPIGNDAASFVYRVTASDGTDFFLKVRTGQGFRAPSIAIPRFLHEQAVPHIVTPVPTLAQTLSVRVSDFVLSLYPFIEARTATEAGLTDELWHTLGRTLRQIHASQLPAELEQIVSREAFVPSRRHVLTNLESAITNPNLADPVQRELSAFWRVRQDEIRMVIDRADTLGSWLRQASLPQVLCHADLHTWNVLLDTMQHMWIVDWDEALLAPKERDLMFVIKGIGHNLIGPHETTCFLQGYGDLGIDRQALVYYRYAWAVQDMAAYAEDVFFSPNLGAQARNDSAHAFVELFAPGNIVAIACASEIGS